MNLWFTRPDAPIVQTYLKRFDPLHWTVDFPRGAIASLVTGADGHSFTVTCEFLREGDLVGLIWESEDARAHPAHARETKLDYSHCTFSFNWTSSGLMALDAVNGPTLTIEGDDEAGEPRTWYVRLWNYASGNGTSARINLNFDALDGGFALPADADRVDPKRIRRMFISLVATGYVGGSATNFPAPVAGSVTISDVSCSGSGSVLTIKDAMVPEHGLRIATAYDDLYDLAPERVIDTAERLGFRGVINHYIGMSHYFRLNGSAKLDPIQAFNSAALEWHRGFARAAKDRGYAVIWSLSYEILDIFCPDGWKQRSYDGAAAQTGWEPPSALVSPANNDAIGFLKSVAEQLVDLSIEAGLQPQVQIGEPWWWVTSAGGICLYDVAAKAALGADPVEIGNVTATLGPAQVQLLDDAGALLAASTATIGAAVRARAENARLLLLAFLPTVLDPRAPELKRANLPGEWADPAFDVLQIEDYDWVTTQQIVARETAYAEVGQRLGYPTSRQHYLSGFVTDAARRGDWRAIIAAAREGQQRGCAEVFLWALPQVMRDGLTLFGGEEGMTAFDDVLFPIEIGQEASVAPNFSTNVVTSASGFEARNANWAQARMRFDAGPGIRGDDELQTLISFFRARRGPAIGFRFRDPYDHSSSQLGEDPRPSDQALGEGDGIGTSFRLVKRYGDGEARLITRPVAGSVRVAVDGVETTGGWSLEPGGVIRFAAPPASAAAISAGFLFDTPVRFAEDRIEVNRATFAAGEAPSVPLIEIREA